MTEYRPATWVLRSRRPALSLRIDRRSVLACAWLLVLLVVAGFAALSNGTSSTSPAEVFSAVTGSAEGRVHTLVIEWRLPRLLLAIVCGAALGMSGAVF
ncbi:MAG: iron chelate uptake ABC transporter family permease subunit, partial [Microterricola sp.]